MRPWESLRRWRAGTGAAGGKEGVGGAALGQADAADRAPWGADAWPPSRSSVAAPWGCRRRHGACRSGCLRGRCRSAPARSRLRGRPRRPRGADAARPQADPAPLRGSSLGLNPRSAARPGDRVTIAAIWRDHRRGAVGRGAERARGRPMPRTPQPAHRERSFGSSGSPPSPTAAPSGPATVRRNRADAPRRRTPVGRGPCTARRTAR